MTQLGMERKATASVSRQIVPTTRPPAWRYGSPTACGRDRNTHPLAGDDIGISPYACPAGSYF